MSLRAPFSLAALLLATSGVAGCYEAASPEAADTRLDGLACATDGDCDDGSTCVAERCAQTCGSDADAACPDPSAADEPKAPTTGGEPSAAEGTHPDAPADAALPRPAESATSVRHAQCEEPFPDAPPSLPRLRLSADGTPAFDAWRSISCEQAAASASLCAQWSSDSEVECGTCLHGATSTDGTCAYGDIDVWCDGEGEAIGLAPGCFICAPPEAHAHACCERLDVDCRAWPYPSDGERGTLCARHDDCEPGLICSAPSFGDTGYGVCRCPDEPPFEWSADCKAKIVYR
jgi:hypothetical protein